jgi:hypothetical protein
VENHRELLLRTKFLRRIPQKPGRSRAPKHSGKIHPHAGSCDWMVELDPGGMVPQHRVFNDLIPGQGGGSLVQRFPEVDS